MASVVVAVALFVGAIAAGWQAWVADRERQAARRAEAAAQHARHSAEGLLNAMLNDVRARLQPLDGLDLLEHASKEAQNNLATAILSLSSARTGFTADDAPEESRNSRRLNLEGTWLIWTEGRPGTTPFFALHTYTAGGGMTATTATGIQGHKNATWVRTANRRFTCTFSAFRFDPARQYLGTNRITSDIRLVGPGEFRSVSWVEIFDVNRKLIGTRHGAAVATRLPLVHLPEHR